MKGFSHNKGIKRSDSFKEKLRNANLGRKLSLEHRSKISESIKKYIHTPEHNKKISL